MAEIQKVGREGELAAQFIEFVMMQTQNASLFLGLTPHPATKKKEVNLPLAAMFIDQLAMIQEKTRGNLSKEESDVLKAALSQLQMAYLQATNQAKVTPSETDGTASVSEEANSVSSEPKAEDSHSDSEKETENKKRFTKSYGS